MPPEVPRLRRGGTPWEPITMTGRDRSPGGESGCLPRGAAQASFESSLESSPSAPAWTPIPSRAAGATAA